MFVHAYDLIMRLTIFDLPCRLDLLIETVDFLKSYSLTAKLLGFSEKIFTSIGTPSTNLSAENEI